MATLDYNSSDINIVPEARLPNNRLRISSHTGIIKKYQTKFFATNGSGQGKTSFASNPEVQFQLGSSNRQVFLSPKESYFQVSLELLDSAGTVLKFGDLCGAVMATTNPLAFSGAHTLVRGFELSHQTSNTMIESMSEQHDVFITSTMASLPADCYKASLGMMGSTLLNRLECAKVAVNADPLVGFPFLNENHLAVRMNGTNTPGIVGEHLRFDPADVYNCTRALTEGHNMVMLLGSSLLNSDGLIPMAYLPLNLKIQLNDPSVFITELGGTYTAAVVGPPAVPASWVPTGRRIYGYNYTISYVATMYMLDEETTSSVEASIMNDDFVLDYEKISINSSNIQTNENTKSINFSGLKMNSANRMLVNFVRSSALNNIKECKYLFSDGNEFNQGATRRGLSEWYVMIGDQCFPNQAIKISNNNYLESLLFSKRVHTNGESILLSPDSYDIQSYCSKKVNQSESAEAIVIQDSSYSPALNSQFYLGCDLRRNSSIQSGVNLTMSNLSLNLSFENNRTEALVAVVALIYDAELHISKDSVYVSY